MVSRVTLMSLLMLIISVSARAQTPRLVVEGGEIWVKNLNPEVLYTFTRYFNTQEDWQSVFPVTTKGHTNGILLPGTYEVLNDAIRFRPRFAFAMHVIYVARFDAAQLALNTNEVYLPSIPAESLELEFSWSRVTQSPSALVSIHPTSNTLPENLLKFHLTFSKSMTLGEVYSKVKLYQTDGREVQKPFLVVDQELWDDQMKTVTILFDPGRIKRGLRPNLEMKPALSAGENYRLVVESGWKDVDGLPTLETVTKNFRCVKPDRALTRASSFEILPPQFETSSLIIDLKEPHDYILLANCLKVFDEHGNLIEGTIELRNNESSIEFVPKNPWLESRYSIRINPLLEDLAGNNLNRLFDEDLTGPSAKDRQFHDLHFKFSRSAQ